MAKKWITFRNDSENRQKIYLKKTWWKQINGKTNHFPGNDKVSKIRNILQLDLKESHG